MVDLKTDLLRRIRELEEPAREKEPTYARRSGARIHFKGRDLVDFTSWDVLSLTQNLELRRVFQHEVETHGVGIASARLHTGGSFEHFIAEERIARFLSQERALIFSTRNQALLSLITSVFGEGDTILVEEGVLSAAVDAAYLVDAQVKIFSRGKLEQIPHLLADCPPSGHRGLFVESISPDHGDLLDLAHVAEICEAARIDLFVDETFALGTIGIRGAGGIERFSIPHKVTGIIGSLAHSLSGYGGFIAGPSLLIKYLLSRSRALRSEISLPVAFAKWAEQAVTKVEILTVERARVARLANSIKEVGSALLFDVRGDSSSPLVVFHFRFLAQARDFYRGLFERGFLCFEPVLSSVDNSVALPFVVRMAHTDQNIKELSQALSDIGAIVKTT
jgi:8-amino-7-oxononanoate synthase